MGQSILSVISSIMEDPFATAYRPCLLAAIKALQATITTCWPRLQEGANFEHVVRSISLCWLNLCEDGDTPGEESDSSSTASEALVDTSKMLETVWSQTHTKPPKSLSDVLGKDTRLVKLFPALSG